MGLDMYLNAKRYVSGFDFRPDEDQRLYRALVKSFGIEGAASKQSPGLRVSVHVGYWRKANAVHSWFVRNVQDGVDECQETSVPRDKLAELRLACKAVIEAPAQGRPTLLTQSGFFDYDEHYIEDLARTVEIIDRALALPDEWTFSYRSSW